MHLNGEDAADPEERLIQTRALLMIVAVLVPSTIGCPYRSVNDSTQRYADVAGTYQACAMHCETLVLKKDGTFELQLQGDLFNDQITFGRWKWHGKFIDIDEHVGASNLRLRLESQPGGHGRALLPIVKPTKIYLDSFYTGRCKNVPSSSDSDTFVVRVEHAETPPLRDERYEITESGIVRVDSRELERVK